MHFVIHSIRVFGFLFYSVSSFATICYHCSQLTKDVVFSRDASEFSLLLSKIRFFLRALFAFVCCYCTSSKFHAHDIFCISYVPAERPKHTHWAMAEKKNAHARESKREREKKERSIRQSFVSFRLLKYVSSLAAMPLTYPFAFSTIYTFQFHFIWSDRCCQSRGSSLVCVFVFCTLLFPYVASACMHFVLNVFFKKTFSCVRVCVRARFPFFHLRWFAYN